MKKYSKPTFQIEYFHTNQSGLKGSGIGDTSKEKLQKEFSSAGTNSDYQPDAFMVDACKAESKK